MRPPQRRTCWANALKPTPEGGRIEVLVAESHGRTYAWKAKSSPSAVPATAVMTVATAMARSA
jgi:hypothetical protein